MARSNIIKDFTSSNISTETALKKLRVLFASLNNKKLINWAKCELEGYSNDDSLPDYRIISGKLMADMITATAQCENYPLDLANLSSEQKQTILSSKVYQSVSSLKTIADSKSPTYKILPQKINKNLSVLCGVNANILASRVQFDYTSIKDILSKIDGKILDTLLTLEDEFGNLDELDIDLKSKNAEDITNIIQHIELNIYDNSISIGNNNKIKNSDIITENR